MDGPAWTKILKVWNLEEKIERGKVFTSSVVTVTKVVDANMMHHPSTYHTSYHLNAMWFVVVTSVVMTCGVAVIYNHLPLTTLVTITITPQL